VQLWSGLMADGRTRTFAELIGQGVLEIGDGYRAKEGEFGDSGPIFLRAARLTEHGLDFADAERFSARLADKVASKLAQPGDTIVTTKGNSVGRTGYVSQNVPAFVYSPHLSYWRSVDHNRLAPGFLRYWAKSPQFLTQLRAMAHSTDMAPYLSLTDQRRLCISVPPISEQNAIAEVLGALDDKTAVNERIADTTLELGKLCYERSYINSSGIREFSIGDVADIFDGPHATPRKTIEGPWFLSISSLKRGRLDLSESAQISEEDFTRWTRRVTPGVGDLLFSYETRLGEAALMPPDIRACLGRRMALMRPRQGCVDSIFFLYSYLRIEFQETIRRRTIHGATVDRIPLVELPSWRIRILDSDEHRPLANLLSALHNKMVLSQRENDTLRELRDTLLPKLVSGELRIKDAESEAEKAV
jgi:type I restriction enzyme S subunit